MSASSKKKLRKEQNAAALTEKQLYEQKEAKKLKGQTVTFVIIIALVLAIGLGALAVTAYNNSGIAERNTTALTIGEHKLSAAELGYFYFDTINSVYDEWYNNYGDYATTYMSLFMGLDVTKPLNEQMYDEENNITFAEYFMDIAVKEAVSVYTMYDLAVADGKTLDEAGKASIDNTMDSLKSGIEGSGYRNVAHYLKSVYGNGATKQSFREYLELQIITDAFKEDTYNSLTYTDSDLAAYNEEHFDDFSSFSYATFYVSVNDLLLCTADEDDEEHEHTQAEKDAALKAAEDVVKAINDAKPATVEDLNKFIRGLDAYAEKESAACIENNDMLYTSITDTDIAAWLADSSRKAGDLTVVTKASETTTEDGDTVSTPYGYYVVLFLERNDNEMKLVNVRHILSAFTGATKDDQGNTVYPEASIKAAEDAINALKKTWEDGSKSEESFAELAMLNSDDTGSALNGGLYEGVYPGQMVAAFNDWCFDEAREPGDYDIVETEYGYHLMYFAGHSDVTFRNFMIENTMRNSDYDKWFQEQVDATAYTVNDTSKIKQTTAMVG